MGSPPMQVSLHVRLFGLPRCRGRTVELDQMPFKVLHTPILTTVDGRNPAPLKKPQNDESPVNTNEQWFPMVSKWCRISSIHSI